MPRRRPQTVTMLGSGSQSAPKRPPVASTAANPRDQVFFRTQPAEGRQKLVLADFPLPALARTLSPNGRAHWRTRAIAAASVAEHVYVAATSQRLRPVRGPVRLLLRYVYPERRARDLDNLSGGGVTKAALDALVAGRWLSGDSTEHVVEVTVKIVVEPEQRRLEIEITPIDGGQ